MSKKTRLIRSYFTFFLSFLLILGVALPHATYAADLGDLKLQAKSNLTPATDSSLFKDTELPELTGVESLQLGRSLDSSSLAPQNFVESSDSNEPITVIVELTNEPLLVYEANAPMSARSSITSHSNILRQEHSTFKSNAAREVGATFNREYSKVFNGYSITLPANEVDSLLELPGVKAIYPNDEYVALTVEEDSGIYNPLMDVSAPFIGAEELWQSGYTGAGIKVGVIDTGVDYNHPSLKGAYKGGYDFVDNDNDPMETLPKAGMPVVDGSTYDTSHGTHVAGTVLGQGDPAQPEAGKGWVRGVAPEADLYAYRVLGPYGRGSTENVIAAIERSVTDGMDLINLSLGSSLNNQYTASSIAADNAMLAGVTVLLANGNAGPGEQTVGSPAASQLAISVGASTPPTMTPIFVSDQAGTVYSQIATYSPELVEGTESELIFANLGRVEDFAGIDVTGKTVLVSRGSISFAEKSINAAEAGAEALIIYNNVSGAFGATLGGPGDYVPTYTTTQTQGLDLKNALDQGHSKVTFNKIQEEDLLADLSSRGPALPNYAIKPDVTAPGVGIVSSIPAFDGDYSEAYESKQGTSMATPHVAGAVALLLEWAEDNSYSLEPTQLKSLLANNAVQLKDRSGVPYRVNEQGAGRIDLPRTVASEAIVKVKESLPSQITGTTGGTYFTSSMSFGQMDANSHATKQITVDNLTNQAQVYQLSVEWYNNQGLTLNPSVNTLFIHQGQSQGSFNVKINIPAGTPDGLYDGQLVLKQTVNQHELKIPFSVFVGDSYDLDPISGLDLSDVVFSPNGDNRFDTLDVSFAVNTPLQDFSFIVFDAAGRAVGYMYDSLSEKNIHDVNYYTYTWDGTVSTGRNVITLTDGFYRIAPVIWDTGELLTKYAQPFLIDVTAPEFSVDNDSVVVSPDKPETAIIQGEILDDLQITYLYDGTNLVDLIAVSALVQTQSGFQQFDGTVSNNGLFNIEVPLTLGNNTFYIFVSDATGNGLDSPGKVLQYNYDPTRSQINLSANKTNVQVNEPFHISADLSVTEAVYQANFDLIYDAKLSLDKVTVGVTDNVYSNLADYTITDLDGYALSQLEPGFKKLGYSLTLTDGILQGSLGQFTLSGTEAGNFLFRIANVQLLDVNGQPIVVYGKGSVDVRIEAQAPVDPTDPVDPNPPGPIEPEPNPGNNGGSNNPVTPTEPNPGNPTNPKPSEPAQPAPTSPSQPIGGSNTTSSSASSTTSAATKQLKAGVLTTKTTNNTQSADLAISSAYLTGQINNKDLATVSIEVYDVSLETYQPLTVTLNSSLTEQLLKSEKPLVIQSNGVTITIPTATIGQFTNKDGLSILLSLSASGDTTLINGPAGSTAHYAAPTLLIQSVNADAKFSEPIHVQLELDDSSVIDRHKVGVYASSTDNQWNYLAAGSSQAGLITFSVSQPGSYTAVEASKDFKDIINHWAKQEISILAAHHLLQGKGSTDSFKPNDLVNQAEFLTLFDRILASGKTWSDRIAEPGARDELTREQIAVLLADAFGAELTGDVKLPAFKDAGQISPEAQAAVAYVLGKGYLQGNPNNTFDPAGKLTRAQAAVIVYRVLEDIQSNR